MRNFFLLIFLTFIYSCGYTSIYQDQIKKDLLINIEETKGDYEINNFIRNDLKIASNLKSTNIYNLSYVTNYKRVILAKDATGKATDYNLDMSVKFKIISKQNKELVFTENFKIKNNSKNFEQSNYEKEIKRNFSRIVKDKLIIYLLKINDN